MLTGIVREAGGTAGLLATWDVAHPERGTRTSSYNLDDATERVLAALLDEASAKRGAGLDDHILGRLRDDAALRASIGSLEVMAIPIRLQDRSVGLVCLLHPSHAAGLLKDTPGVYSFRFDAVDIVLQNARLLQRLLAERKWLEAVVAQNADGMAVIDGEGRVVGFNPAMQRLTDWSLDEAVGRTFSDVFPLRFGDGAAVAGLVPVEAELFVSAGGAHREGRLRTRAGDWVDVEARCTVLCDDAGGAPLGWALTVRDIRERKEKERLERIFLSSVSHELQTPIAVIKGFSGLISDTEAGLTLAQAREKAAIIHEESARLERMVGQLLLATRLQAGGLERVVEPVDLGGLMRNVTRRLQGLAQARGMTLEVEAPAEPSVVACDAEKIEQVLVNLVENALKHGCSPKGHEVRLRLEETSSEMVVSVRDHGCGVPVEDRQRVFHVFERGRGGTRASGSGLGLFISKAIIEAHGGSMGIDDAPGGGARFWFTLPRQA